MIIIIIYNNNNNNNNNLYSIDKRHIESYKYHHHVFLLSSINKPRIALNESDQENMMVTNSLRLILTNK